MARLMASSNYKVLLIDADCRRPSIHEEMQVSLQPGLTELLRGEAEYENVLATDERSGAKVIAAGRVVPDAPGLLDSAAFEDLLRKAERSFDLIVIDSPPIMVGADSTIMSKKVAATVLAVRWGSTPRKLVEAAIHELQVGDGQIVACFLSKSLALL